MACRRYFICFKTSKNNDGPFKYVLIAQDVFSRKIWTRAMSDLTQVTYFFEDILQESKLFDSDGTNEYPDILTTDNGTEFTNEKFKAVCVKYNIDQLYKTPGTHDIGTIDRAIGVWKKSYRGSKMQRAAIGIH